MMYSLGQLGSCATIIKEKAEEQVHGTCSSAHLFMSNKMDSNDLFIVFALIGRAAEYSLPSVFDIR